MAQTVLITGSTSAVEKYAAAVSAAGATPVVAGDMPELLQALESLDGAPLKHYIQLPTSISSRSGSTVTARVHQFLVDGLLSRYRTAETVLPVLADDARAILVSGNVNTETTAPDDRAARLSLVHVLKHSLRADKASKDFDVRVAPSGSDPDRVVAAVLTGSPLDDDASHRTAAVDPGLDYIDWRTEVLGGMNSEF